jgi:hypothetical protein
VDLQTETKDNFEWIKKRRDEGTIKSCLVNLIEFSHFLEGKRCFFIEIVIKSPITHTVGLGFAPQSERNLSVLEIN